MLGNECNFGVHLGGERHVNLRRTHNVRFARWIIGATVHVDLYPQGRRMHCGRCRLCWRWFNVCITNKTRCTSSTACAFEKCMLSHHHLAIGGITPKNAHQTCIRHWLQGCRSKFCNCTFSNTRKSSCSPVATGAPGSMILATVEHHGVVSTTLTTFISLLAFATVVGVCAKIRQSALHNRPCSRRASGCNSWALLPAVL